MKPAVQMLATERTKHAVMRAEGLRKSFGGKVVLDDVSLTLRPGVVLLRGDNGSGKTTLLNIVTGNLEPDKGVIELWLNGAHERIAFPRSWWTRVNPFDHFTPERMARLGVGRSWQDVRLFATQTLQNNIAVATPRQTGEHPLGSLLAFRSAFRQEANNVENARACLAKFGLVGRENSSADLVSLGQAKRVAIARAVQAGAKILFLDEPLSGLDNAGIEQMLAFLRELEQSEISLVVVEHATNIPRVLNHASEVWTLENGRLIVEEPATVQAEYQACSEHGMYHWLTTLAGDGGVLHRELPGGAVLSVVRLPSFRPDRVVLDLDRLQVRRGSRLVAGDGDGLSMKLCAGELGVLQAPNGWGKTSLLEAVAGLIPATANRLHLHDQPLLTLSPWHRRRLGLSLLQTRMNTFPGLTVAESLRVAGADPAADGVQSLMGRRVTDLSGGERQRLALLSALAPPHALLLLDEPLAALDQRGAAEFKRLITQTPAATLIAVPKGPEMPAA